LDHEAGGQYHGIIVEEGLEDPTLVASLLVLGKKRGREWTLVRVGVEELSLPALITRLQSSLRVEGGVPFYAHFYRPRELIVVFPEAVFRITPGKETWSPAVTYGASAGIPVEELDFSPCRFEEETW
jgi:hypothetical protein